MKTRGGPSMNIRENRGKTPGRSNPGLLSFAWLMLLALVFLAADKGSAAGENRAVGAEEIITLDGAKSILGTANDYASGVVDLNKGNDEVIIAYRYYDADLDNYETDFATEVAPKIQALYKKFPTLNRIHFQVTANSASAPFLWKPFVEFTLDRKTVGEIRWTGFLTRYLLDLILRSKK